MSQKPHFPTTTFKLSCYLIATADGPCGKRSDMEILVFLGSSRCFIILVFLFCFHLPRLVSFKHPNTRFSDLITFSRKYKSVGEVFCLHPIRPRMPETNAPPKVRSVGKFLDIKPTTNPFSFFSRS